MKISHHKCAISGTLEEALLGADDELCKSAVECNIASLFENNMWKDVLKPHDVQKIEKIISFDKKIDNDNSFKRYEARRVVKGYKNQLVSAKYYVPVIHFTTVRVAVSFDRSRLQFLHQL